MSIPTLVTFVIYFLFLLAIGFYFYKKSKTIEDYLLGGRRMGAWVTALSAQASDMSGWLLMALPGAVYLYGMPKVWIAVGLFIGTVLNWSLVSTRLRVYTEKTSTITLPCFFEERFRDPTGLLRIVSAVIILIFFTIYVSAGLVSSGKLFDSVFGINYTTAVLLGGMIIIVYTFLGGFFAVCWTDLFQGLLMIAAIVVVPTIAFFHLDGTESIIAKISAKGISTSLIDRGAKLPALAIVSSLAWGLGYFGQPHILARFMSAGSLTKLKESMAIAIVWVFVSLTGAVVIGFLGIAMFDLAEGTHEKVFIYMIDAMFNPWVGGVMLAAVFSAIMSTVDSQLLVSSSVLAEDFYQKSINPNATAKEVIVISRICVVIVSVVAMALAMRPEGTILGIVAYAWGGFGAAFGPLILFGLFSRRTTWVAALAGMVTGTVVLVVWKELGLGEDLYEIVPGFAANCAMILLVNTFIPQKDPAALEKYEEVKKHLKP